MGTLKVKVEVADGGIDVCDTFKGRFRRIWNSL
jgi:hypothetical protein